MDGFFQGFVAGDGQLDGLLGTDVHTTPATPAGVANDSLAVRQVNGVNETCALGAGSAAHAPVRHFDGHTGHGCDLGADLVRDVRQHPPEAAAGATVADRQQPVSWPNAEPKGIELVATDQVYQTCLPATPGVFQRFLFCDAAPKPGIDACSRLAKKEAAQVNRVVLTAGGMAADAGIHDPVMGSLLDKMGHYLGGQDHLAWVAEYLVDRNGLILGQVEEVVAGKEQTIGHCRDGGDPGQAGEKKTMGEKFLQEFHEPNRSAHVRTIAQ